MSDSFFYVPFDPPNLVQLDCPTKGLLVTECFEEHIVETLHLCSINVLVEARGGFLLNVLKLLRGSATFGLNFGRVDGTYYFHVRFLFCVVFRLAFLPCLATTEAHQRATPQILLHHAR